MKKLIYIALLLFTGAVFSQGGPVVDAIKYRGEVTTTVRDAFDVPIGQHWLLWNVTTGQFEHAGSDDVWSALAAEGALTEGTNAVPTGVTFRQSALNSIEVKPDGTVGGTDFVRIIAGESPNEVYLYLTSDYAAIGNYSIADIDAVGDAALITKEKLDAELGLKVDTATLAAYMLKTGTTMSGTLNMGSNQITAISNLTFSGYIDGANELRLTPDNTIGSTSGKNSFSFKTGNVAYLKKVDASIGLGLDYTALTANKNLTFTDDDVLWGPVSLVSSSGSLLASDNVWAGSSNTFENAITMGGALGDGGQIIMVGEGIAETSQMVFYDNAFTGPLAAMGYNTTQSGIFLANTTSSKFLILEDAGDLTYNGDIDITGNFKKDGVDIIDAANLLGTETATTSRTAVLTDADGILQITNASAMTYTVPTNATVAFPVGAVISIKQMDDGPITLAYSGGVTGEAGGTYAKNDRIVIRKTATDTWEVLQHPTFREMTAAAYSGITPIDGILYVIVD